MRTLKIIVGLLFFMMLGLMISSYKVSIFTNALRIPINDSENRIIFFHSVHGYIMFGNYQLPKSSPLRMGPLVDRIRDEHGSFKFCSRRHQFGFFGALLNKDPLTIGSNVWLIHDSVIVLLLFLVLLLMYRRKSLQ